MFKRIDKRRKRVEEDAALGLDDEMKEVLGLQDTDSDESSETSSENESEVDMIEESGSSAENNGEASSDRDESIESEPDNDTSRGTETSTTVAEALTNPVIVLGISDLSSRCLVCPGRVLKSPHMIAEHLKAKAHVRRMRHFKKLVKEEHIEDDALAEDIVTQMNTLSKQNVDDHLPAASTLSKRALKKKERRKKFNAKRTERRSRIKSDNPKMQKQRSLSPLSTIQDKPVEERPLKPENNSASSANPPKKRRRKSLDGQASANVMPSPRSNDTVDNPDIKRNVEAAEARLLKRRKKVKSR